MTERYFVTHRDGDLYEDGINEDGEPIVRRGAPYWEVYDLFQQGYRSYHVAAFDTEAEATALRDELAANWAEHDE